MSTETIETLIRLRNKMLAHGLTVAADMVHDEMTNDHAEWREPTQEDRARFRDAQKGQQF